MSSLVSYITYVLNEKMLGRDTFAYFKELIKAEQCSERELEEFQFLKLRKLLTHAYSYTDHYKELFDKAGIEPAKIRTPEDIDKIPFLTKSDIRYPGPTWYC